MAYAQWVSFGIDIKGFSVIIQSVDLKYGKFYESDKDKEVASSKVNGKVLTPDDSKIISACGRSDSASGTEGSFDIYLYDASTKKATDKLSHVYWDCPWGRKSNSFSATSENDKYIVGHSNVNLDSGALGDITIKIRKCGE